MKKNNYEIVMTNKDEYTYFDNTVNEDKLISDIGKTDKIRLIFCYVTAIIMVAAMLVVSTVIRDQLTNILISMLYMLGGAALWGILYFGCGLLLYRNIKLSWYFKDLKSPLKDKYLPFSGSSYGKWVEKYAIYLGKVDFNVPTKNKTKRKMVGFILVEPKKRKFIYNGKVDTNVPYYCITFRNHNKMAFLPGYILYTAGSKTKIMKYKDLNVAINQASDVVKQENAKRYQSEAYHYVELKDANGALIQSFFISKGFNQNFFNFKW